MYRLLRLLPATAGGLRWCLALLLTGSAFPALAFNIYLDDFNTNYSTQGTRLDTCGLCHNDFNGGGPRTTYGEDYRNNNFSAANIGQLDSDGDGFTNDQEAAQATLTHPGFSCTTLNSALNAPANLADYVDPNNVGCAGPGQPPVANPNGPYVAVNGEPLTFSSAGSSDADGTITAYLWNFGGGFGTSTEPNPVFTYNLGFQATITVSLTVTDNDGNTDTATTTVSLLTTPNSLPTADAGAAVSGVANSPVAFDGSGSSDPEGTNLSYRWDFGDGSIGTGVAPSHSYTRCGTYDVTLTVSDAVNLTGSAATTATIASTGVDAPSASAGGGTTSHYDGTTGTNVQFDGSASLDSDCDIVSYDWDFGDGSSGQGVNPVHSYALAGDYVATLTVTDNDGLTAIATATVTVVDAGPLDGAALYDTHCGACHGVGDASTKIGATVARIDAGIADVASMNFLATTLSAAEIQAISDYLVSLTPPPPPPPPPGGSDGATLYADHCANCHGAGDASTKIGATVARIDAGIADVASMNFLATTLSAADVQAISDYLVSLTPPPPPPPPPGGSDGATLYADHCANCHGAGDASTKIGATVARIDAGIADVASMNFLATTLSAADVQAISDYLVSLTPPPPPPPPPGGSDGATLYADHCANCHGAGDASTKIGATVARIDAGIADVASMNFLATTLSAADVQAISDYLMSLTPPPPPPGGSDGATLYANNCASCHGAGDNSGKAGATAARINAGIANEPTMNFLSTILSAADVQTIADFLATAAPPTTPEGLYVAHCGACHGADGSGGTSGEDVRGDSAQSITEAILDEPEMQSLGFLTNDEVQLISDFLNGITAPPPPGPLDGAALYDTNCAGCHGPGDSSAKAGATVDRINNGITTAPSMNFLGTLLSAAEIQAIADFLAVAAPPPTGGDGETLYALNCASCHGPGDSSGKAGATVARINNGITAVPSMNFLSTVLTAGDVQAIADFLAAAAPPTTPEGLYLTFCGACHGVDASGGSSGENVQGDSSGDIRDAIEDEKEMQFLDFLTSDQIRAIAQHLDTLKSDKDKDEEEDEDDEDDEDDD